MEGEREMEGDRGKGEEREGAEEKERWRRVCACVISVVSLSSSYRTLKISSKGLTSNSAKGCTSENFPL